MLHRTYKGVAYFATAQDAKDFGKKYCDSFPHWRIVEYTRGYAVQTENSGDYLGSNGLPSLINADNRKILLKKLGY